MFYSVTPEQRWTLAIIRRWNWTESWTMRLHTRQCRCPCSCHMWLWLIVTDLSNYLCRFSLLLQRAGLHCDLFRIVGSFLTLKTVWKKSYLKVHWPAFSWPLNWIWWRSWSIRERSIWLLTSAAKRPETGVMVSHIQHEHLLSRGHMATTE